MSFGQIVVIIISMVLVNNYPLAQFLGICPFLGVSKDLDSAKGMGMAVTVVMGLASLVTFPIQQLLLSLGIEYMQTVVFILVIAALVQFIEMFMKKSMPALYQSLGIYLPLITTNCAVLGVCISNTEDYTVAAVGSFGAAYVYAVVQGIAGGLGFWLAMTIMAGVRMRLGDTKGVPQSFKGVPIVLTTAAILALAFMGFSGIV